MACNVAEVVFDELGRDNIVFRNPVYAKIMETYRGQWERLGTGTEVPAHCFLNHIDPEEMCIRDSGKAGRTGTCAFGAATAPAAGPA